MAPGSRGACVSETHSAYLFLVGEHAYKLKKPVDLGFLDFTTREARQAVCQREVELNRRLAPDVYLGVADVFGPDGHPCDHLVVMRRMPSNRRLSTLVRQGANTEPELWRLAHLLAAFHARSPRTPAADHAAGIAATRARWHANTAELAVLPSMEDQLEEVALVQRLADRYLDGRGDLFKARIADGRACDGHGDLLADDIFCLDDGPRVLDCIEFDDRLRLGDGLADVAFLAMDLEHLGRPDLAALFLDAYREHRDDAWPMSLAHHHIAYRAQVRAKVTAIRATQDDDPDRRHDAQTLLRLAHTHLQAGTVTLTIVGGLPGAGKSTVADGLGAATGATVISSDEVRKEQAGLDVDAAAPAPYRCGLYDPAHTAHTYQTLLDRAAVALRHGESVVLDASWTAARFREQALITADRCSVPLIELRCDVPPHVAEARILRRQARPGARSDATPTIAEAMAAAADPWPTASTVDTSQSIADSVQGAAAIVLERVHGL